MSYKISKLGLGEDRKQIFKKSILVLIDFKNLKKILKNLKINLKKS
jgi:hypothetical protein